MALIPKDAYPSQTLTADPAYPQGKAQNEIVEGDGTGTPWEAQHVNDLWGYLQALLAEGAVTPSGTPDEVGASQYLSALKSIMKRRGVATAARNTTDSGISPGTTGNAQFRAMAASPTTAIAVGNDTTAGIIYSSFSGKTVWQARASALTTGHSAAAYDAANGLFIVGTGGHTANSADHGLETSPDGITWTSRLTGGQVYAIGSDDAGTSLAFVRDNASGDLVVYRSADGINWAATAAAPGNADVRGVAWNGSRWLVACPGGGIFTSDDDGGTWDARASGTIDHFEDAAWDEVHQTFLAMTATALYSSADGETWASTGLAAADLTAMAVYDGVVCLVSSLGQVLVTTTPDEPSSWEESLDPNSLYAVAFFEVRGRWVAGGLNADGGALSYSAATFLG